MANIISAMCKEVNTLRFVKLSATMAGINDVKEVVKVAKNENQYKRQTVLFMDEIHRYLLRFAIIIICSVCLLIPPSLAFYVCINILVHCFPQVQQAPTRQLPATCRKWHDHTNWRYDGKPIV